MTDTYDLEGTEGPLLAEGRKIGSDYHGTETLG
jgi:hypothetical protein